MLRSVPHKRRWALMASSCCGDTHRSACVQQHWTAAAHHSLRVGQRPAAPALLVGGIPSLTSPPQQLSSRTTRHRLLQVADASAFRALHSSGGGLRGGGPLLHGGHHHGDETMEAEEKATAQRTPEMEAMRGKEMTRMSATGRSPAAAVHLLPAAALAEHALPAVCLLLLSTLLGMLSNIGLTMVKALAGFLGNSVAMIADAVHSVSDLLTDFVTLWASKVSLKPRDSSHPYGHGKFESLGALIISGLLVGTGAGIGWQSIEHMQLILAGKSLGTPTGIALVGAVVSIAVKELVYQSTMKVGERYDSKVIKANAWHHRSDAISSVVALVGVLGGMLSVPIVDPVAGLFVSALIVKAAVELGWDSLKDLTDQNVSPRVIAQVEKLLAELKADGVVGWHQLRGRRMGPYMILDVHIVVDPKLSVTVSHQIAEKVRVKIVNAMPAVSEVLVHIDPAGAERETQQRRRLQLHSAETAAQRSSFSSAASSSAAHVLSQSHSHSHPELGDDDVSHSHHTGDERDSPALSHTLRSSAAESGPLMRPQQEIEADVRAVLRQPVFDGKVLALTHFTCHFIDGRLCCQLELVMQETLTVGQAREVAREVDARLRAAVADVDSVDVHLELNGSHISQATSIQKATVGDTQEHMNTEEQQPQPPQR